MCHTFHSGMFYLGPPLYKCRTCRSGKFAFSLLCYRRRRRLHSSRMRIECRSECSSMRALIQTSKSNTLPFSSDVGQTSGASWGLLLTQTLCRGKDDTGRIYFRKSSSHIVWHTTFRNEHTHTSVLLLYRTFCAFY